MTSKAKNELEEESTENKVAPWSRMHNLSSRNVDSLDGGEQDWTVNRMNKMVERMVRMIV